jgi:hypothetical protein
LWGAARPCLQASNPYITFETLVKIDILLSSFVLSSSIDEKPGDLERMLLIM